MIYLCTRHLSSHMHTVLMCFILLLFNGFMLSIYSSHSGYSTSDHYSDVIMSAMASQMSSFTIVYSIVHSGTDQRKQQSSVNSPHKGLVTRKMFPFDDVTMSRGATVWVISHNAKAATKDNKARQQSAICFSFGCSGSVVLFWWRQIGGNLTIGIVVLLNQPVI